MKGNTHRFCLVNKEDVYNTSVYEYREESCKLRVFFVQTERPLLDVVFLIPTEPTDNSGCAHALEHLIFFGGKHYPYRGIIDALASRCLTETSNAWTAVDHTAYTITTAGYTGFLNLFPVYLDHIMHPLITESAVLTEIHHINKDGQSEGVVYSELEATEYQCAEVVERQVRRQLYAKESAYRFDAGGYLNEVRQLNVETLTAFHQKFYRWDNMSIILVGAIPMELFLEKLSNYLTSENAQSTTCAPPWTTPVPRHLATSSRATVNFPTFSAHDQVCEVVFAWRGPQWNDFRERLVIETLGHYLATSPASPLETTFVNIPYPKTSGIYFSEEPYKETFYSLTFFDVPKKYLNKINTQFVQVLTELLNGKLNVKQLRATITLLLALYEHELEESPEDGYGDVLVEYIVNSAGMCDKELFRRMWRVEDTFTHDLMLQPGTFWEEKLAQYFLDPPRIEVHGVPDFQLSKTLEKEKKQHEKKQKEWASSSSRAEAYQKKVQDAKAIKVSIPQNVLESFPLIPFSDVKTFHLTAKTNFGTQTLSNDDLVKTTPSTPVENYVNALHFPTSFCDIPSQFVELRLLIRLPIDGEENSSNECLLTDEEISLLPLLCELIFNSSVSVEHMNVIRPETSQQALTHEEYTRLLVEHLVEQRAFLGAVEDTIETTSFPEILTVYFCARKTKLSELGEFLLTTINSLLITEPRVTSMSRSMFVQSLRRLRRASAISRAAHVALRYDRTSIRALAGTLHQQQILQKVSKDPKSYVTKLQGVYRKIFSPVRGGDSSGFLLHFVGDSQAILGSTSLTTIIQTISSSSGTGYETLKKDLPHLLRIPSPRSQRAVTNASTMLGTTVVLESSTVEGGLVTFSCPGIGYVLNHDLAHLLALAEMFSNGDAGPLFNAVRTSGSAYGAGLDVSFQSSEIVLHLRNCSDIITALSTTLSVFDEFSQHPNAYTDTLVHSSKSSVFLRLLRSQNNYFDYALEKLHHLCLGLPDNFSQFMVQELSHVTAKTLHDTMTRYLLDLRSFLFHTTSHDTPGILIIVTGYNNGTATLDALRSYLKEGMTGQKNVDVATLGQAITWNNLAAWCAIGDPSATDAVKLSNEDLQQEGSSSDGSDSDASEVPTHHQRRR